MFLNRKSAVVGIIAGASIALSAIGASAATYTYSLFDHEDGAKKDYDYGLRLDQTDPDRFFSFTHGAAELVYDDIGMTASIGGTMRESLSGDGMFGDEFKISYTITDIEDLGMGAFRAKGGKGEIDGVELGFSALDSGDDKGFSFIFRHDGHRVAGDSTSTIGRGWVSKAGGSNDFLFRSTLTSVDVPPAVPLPATGLLLLGAMGGLAGMRRLRRKS